MLDFGRGPLTVDARGPGRGRDRPCGGGGKSGRGQGPEDLRDRREDHRLSGSQPGDSGILLERFCGWLGLFTTYDAKALVEEIRRAEEGCDFTVVYVPLGNRAQHAAGGSTRGRWRGRYIGAGADAVIGSHPHVLQGIEYYQGKPIFYSLGNFIFSNGSYETMLAELTLEENGTGIRLIPCVSEANQMRLLRRKRLPAFYQSLESLSPGIAIDGDGRVSSARQPGSGGWQGKCAGSRSGRIEDDENKEE